MDRGILIGLAQHYVWTGTDLFVWHNIMCGQEQPNLFETTLCVDRNILIGLAQHYVWTGTD